MLFKFKKSSYALNSGSVYRNSPITDQSQVEQRSINLRNIGNKGPFSVCACKLEWALTGVRAGGSLYPLPWRFLRCWWSAGPAAARWAHTWAGRSAWHPSRWAPAGRAGAESHWRQTWQPHSIQTLCLWHAHTHTAEMWAWLTLQTKQHILGLCN